MLGFLGRFAPNQITCGRLGCTATGDVGKAFVELQRQLSNATGQKLFLDGRLTATHVAMLTALAQSSPKSFAQFSQPFVLTDVAQLAVELSKAITNMMTPRAPVPTPTFTSTLPPILPTPPKPPRPDPGGLPPKPAQDTRTTTSGVPLPNPFPEPPEPGKTDEPSMPETTADGGNFPYPTTPAPLPMIDPSKIAIIPSTAFKLNQKQIIFGSVALAAVTALGVIGGVVAHKRRKLAPA